MRDHNSSMMTEYAMNGSVVSVLVAGGLSDATGMAKVMTGIALAMWFVHSRGAIDRDLGPETISVDWDWTVNGLTHWPSIDPRYQAAECYEGPFGNASNVFAFGLILFETLTGHATFSAALRLHNIAYLVVVPLRTPDVRSNCGTTRGDGIQDDRGCEVSESCCLCERN
jgi:hypothetical protein